MEGISIDTSTIYIILKQNKVKKRSKKSTKKVVKEIERPALTQEKRFNQSLSYHWVNP